MDLSNLKYVIYTKKNQIATIALNLPDRLNVIDFPWEGGIFDDLNACVDDSSWDDEIKCVIFKGMGKSFCAGHDLTKIYKVYENFDKEPGKRRPSQHARLKIDRFWYEMEHKILIHPKVTICQVQGHCLGEGALIAEACDFTICTNDAKIGHPEQRLGFSGSGIPTIPILYLKIGYTRARDLLLTGRVMSGVEAANIGWATKSVAPEDLEAEVNEIARQITLLPRDGLDVGKSTNHMILDAMGITSGWSIGYYSHTLFTNLRYEENEWNFVSNRSKKGAKDSFHERDGRYEKK